MWLARIRFAYVGITTVLETSAFKSTICHDLIKLSNGFLRFQRSLHLGSPPLQFAENYLY